MGLSFALLHFFFFFGLKVEQINFFFFNLWVFLIFIEGVPNLFVRVNK